MLYTTHGVTTTQIFQLELVARGHYRRILYFIGTVAEDCYTHTQTAARRPVACTGGQRAQGGSVHRGVACEGPAGGRGVRPGLVFI